MLAPGEQAIHVHLVAEFVAARAAPLHLSFIMKEGRIHKTRL